MSASGCPVRTSVVPLCRRKQSFINDRFLSDSLVDFRLRHRYRGNALGILLMDGLILGAVSSPKGGLNIPKPHTPECRGLAIPDTSASWVKSYPSAR